MIGERKMEPFSFHRPIQYYLGPQPQIRFWPRIKNWATSPGALVLRYSDEFAECVRSIFRARRDPVFVKLAFRWRLTDPGALVLRTKQTDFSRPY